MIRRRPLTAALVALVLALVAVAATACGSGKVDDSPEARAIGAAQLARTAERYLVAPAGFRLAAAETLPGGLLLRDRLAEARTLDTGFVDISFRWILGGGDALVGQLIVTVLDPRVPEGDRRALREEITGDEGVEPQELRIADRSVLRYGRAGDTSYLWQDGAVFVYAAGPEPVALERFLAGYLALDR
jgi:hypothetical protein